MRTDTSLPIEKRTSMLPVASKSRPMTFTSQPEKRARASLLQVDYHDWRDIIVVKMLSNMVPAISLDSIIKMAGSIFLNLGPVEWQRLSM